MHCYPTAYVNDFKSLTELDADLASIDAQGKEIPADLLNRRRRLLDILERIVVERAGRSDSFARRFLESRR